MLICCTESPTDWPGMTLTLLEPGENDVTFMLKIEEYRVFRKETVINEMFKKAHLQVYLNFVLEVTVDLNIHVVDSNID